LVSEHTRIRHGHVARPEETPIFLSLSISLEPFSVLYFIICTHTGFYIGRVGKRRAHYNIKVEAGKNKARRQLLKNDATFSSEARERSGSEYILFRNSRRRACKCVYLVLKRAQWRPIYGRKKQQFGPISGKRALAALFMERVALAIHPRDQNSQQTEITSNYSL
jgi:hypothetical protein